MSHSNFMKFPIPVVFLATSVLVAGCNSLDNPLAGMNLLGTGHDGRVYNAQTGEFEWPKDSQKRRAHRPAPAATGTAGTATEPPQRKSDGRYYDPQKSQWVEVQEETSHTTSGPKPKKATPPPVVLMTTPKPVGTPLPERSPRARGTYNASTGQIEWNDFDPPATAKPEPEKKKNWYWPF